MNLGEVAWACNILKNNHDDHLYVKSNVELGLTKTQPL